MSGSGSGSGSGSERRPPEELRGDRSIDRLVCRST